MRRTTLALLIALLAAATAGCSPQRSTTDESATEPARWRVQGGNAALLIGGMLILVQHAGGVRVGRISPAGYQSLATFDAGLRELKAVPAYWNGRLFLRNEAGRLVCFQIGTLT